MLLCVFYGHSHCSVCDDIQLLGLKGLMDIHDFVFYVVGFELPDVVFGKGC